MDHSSGQRETGKGSVWKNMIAGGCCFGFLIPAIVAITFIITQDIKGDAGSSSMFSGSSLDGLVFFISFVVLFIPATLIGILMGLLGRLFSRGWLVCCGTFAGTLLALVVMRPFASAQMGTAQGAGSFIAVPLMTIIPLTGILSWWLHGWIKKRPARHDDALAG